MLPRACHPHAHRWLRLPKGRGLAALVCGTLCSIGCWCSTEPTPSRTVERVVAAAEQADVVQMQRNLVDERDEEPALADVEASLEREGNSAIRGLRAAGQHPAPPRISARYTLANGSVVVLSKEQGEYRIRVAPLLPACPETVLEALLGFRMAVESRPWPASVAPLTAQAKMGIEHEHRALLAGLRYLDELDVVEVAAAARVTLPSGHVISLRSERGCWLVDEVS